ncbi:unnamed protein product [Blepharisma stoltei]|uniref:MIR domain-containing protein n=1 Tax=Blepharisma stoltei TaxID=1481888 RepID=A0AAU9J6K4_9CILI|nr:unnamed protein product [Blepharisma stoltei]
MDKDINSTRFLHYGSLINLKTLDNYYIYSQGFIETTPFLQPFTEIESNFIGAVFRIIPQCQYSTQKEILRYISDANGIVQAEKLERLEDSLDGEIKTNTHTYNTFKGEAIKYGSLVQLEHIHSHRFLALQSKTSAESEKENFRLTLEDFGSEYSHFRIEPSYKYQKEGSGLVRLKDKVLFELMVPELNRAAYLHASKGPLIIPPMSRLSIDFSVSQLVVQEVNASLDQKTKWAIDLYAPVEKKGAHLLACGNYVWLSRTEEGVCLSMFHKEDINPKVIYSDNLNDTNGLWMIEGEDLHVGGLVKIGNKYRLKHMSTGKYLVLKTVTKIVGEINHKVMLKPITHPNSLWMFIPLESKSGVYFLNSEQHCKIVNATISGATITGKVITANNVTSFSPVVEFFSDDLTYFKVSRANGEVAWETLFLLNCKPILQSFPEFMAKNADVLSRGPKAMREYEKYLKLIEKCLDDLELFCKNKLKSMVGLDNQYGQVQRARQRILREQRFFEDLTEILKNVFISYEEIERVKMINTAEKSYGEEVEEAKNDFKSIEMIKITLQKSITEKAYSVISAICHKNMENQIYACDFFKIFVKHVGLNLGATKCMHEIVKDNEKILLELHDTFTTSESKNLIQHFAWLLKQNYRTKKPEILEFLKTICVHKGDGVTVNQEKVFESIFTSPKIYKKVLIPVSECEGNLYISLGETRSDLISLDSCFRDGKIINHSAEIIYFTKLLELFGCLCIGRNFLCTESLKDHFSSEVLQNMIWNVDISKKVRAAFCRLILTIHVDAFPREEIKRPELIKVLRLRGRHAWEDKADTRFCEENIDFVKSFEPITDQEKKNIFDKVKKPRNFFQRFSSSSISPLTEESINKIKDEDRWIHILSMNLLKFFNYQYLRPQYDVLTLEMLKLSDKMFRFDIYGAVCTNLENGTILSDPENPYFNEKKMDMIKFLSSINHIYFYNAQSSSNTKSKSLSKKKSRLLADKQKKKLSKNSFLSALLNDPASLSDPIIRGALNLRNFLQALQQNYVILEKTDYENKIKIKICKIMHYYMDWRQDFLVFNISSWFNKQSEIKSENLSKKLKKLLPNVMKIADLNNSPTLQSHLSQIYSHGFENYYKPEISDLNCISSTPIIGSLLKTFVCSNHYKLQAHTLNLIIRCFKQREEFLISVKRLCAISSREDMNLLRWLRGNINKFRQNSEQSELWLNYWKRNDSTRIKYLRKFEEVMKFLTELCDLFYEDSIIGGDQITLGKKETISKSRQDIMYYLGVHELIITLLKDGMHTLVSLYDSADENLNEPRNKIGGLYTQCHKILRRFVYGHSKNQKRLHKHLHVFLQYLRINVEQIPLICEIFRDNPELILKITKDIIRKFKKLIYREGRQPEFLEFFETIQIAKGKPVPQMQRIIIRLFVKEEFNRYLLYMDDEPEPNFSFEPEENEKSSWTYRDMPFAYHAKLFKVLSKCGLGVSGMYMNEARIQKMVKLPKVFNLLIQAEDKTSPYHILKIPILELFFNIYLDCEKIVDDLKESKDFIAYINRQSEAIDLIDVFDKDYVQFLLIWLKILNKYSLSYINNREIYSDKDDFIAVESFAKALCEHRHHFSERKMPEKLLEAVMSLCSQFKVEFMPIAYEEADILISDEIENVKENESERVARYKTHYQLSSISTEQSKHWDTVKEEFIYNEEFKEPLLLEQKALRAALMYAHELDPDLTFDSIAQTLVNFVRNSRSQQTSVEVIVEAIKLLGSLIENPICGEYDDPDLIKENIQNKLNGFGAGRMALTLMSESEINPEMFIALLDFSIQLLEGGNPNVQKEFYQFFVRVPNSESFFQRIHKLFLECLEEIGHGIGLDITRKPIFKSEKPKMGQILRLLQLLCENHNDQLQNYIRFQDQSRNSFDMIEDTVFLLEILVKKMFFKYFHVTSQCLDALTEFIQGPCKQNQERIIDSKFLELAACILSLDENSQSIQPYESFKDEGSISKMESLRSQESTEDYELCRGWMIAHLKYKCMITILSLLEGREDNYVMSRLIRAFNIEIFKENLMSIYANYIRLYKGQLYDYAIFNHHMKNEEYQFGVVNAQDTNPEYFRVIIETGFMIYHLMKYFQDNDDPENQEIIDEELPKNDEVEESDQFIGAKLIGGLGKFGMALVKDAVFGVAKLAQFNDKSVEIDKETLLEDAYDFFDTHTGNVEVVFNGKIRKVYFSFPPDFSGLSNEIKETFSRDADRTSDQTKLRYLAIKAPEIAEQMSHEYKIQKFFTKYPLVNSLASNVWLWRYFAFILTILLNFFIIVSYSYYGTHNLFHPSLFYDTDGSLNSEKTLRLIQTVGLIQVVICCLIVLFFLLKSGLILAIKGWKSKSLTNEFWKSNPSKLKIIIGRSKQVISTIIWIASDVNVYYYFGYLLVACLGTFHHPFWFSLLLMDMLYQFPSLQNVIKSITMPRKALIVTFVFMIVIVYIFGLIGYWKFSNWFNDNCPSLYYCTVNVWDKGFKANGGIGGYLGQPTDGTLDWARLAYDNLYNIIIMIIMLNIVQGIIIDTFAVLREAHERDTEDKNNKCFICGMERDLIERVTNKPFRYHTLYEHNEWNYILYMAYIQTKAETEYTGLESYVREQIDKKDFMWIPQHQALSVKEEEDSDEKVLVDNIEKVESKLVVIEDELKEIKRNLE